MQERDRENLSHTISGEASPRSGSCPSRFNKVSKLSGVSNSQQFGPLRSTVRSLPIILTRTAPRGSGAGAGGPATVNVGEGVPNGGSICQRNENCGAVPLQPSVQMQGSW